MTAEENTMPQFTARLETDRTSIIGSYPVSHTGINYSSYLRRNNNSIIHELDNSPRETQPCRIEININPEINPDLLSQALSTINQRLQEYFDDVTHNSFVNSKELQNPLSKCQDCVWLHKRTKFCAVAPQNLTSLECGDRQISEPSENLDYLDARSPERIALVQDLAQKLDMEPEALEQKLFQGWLKNRDLFESTAKGQLFIKTQIMEIETLGAYSIAQLELIRDAIGLNTNSVPFLSAYSITNRIKGKILAGYDFDDIMRSLLLVS